MSEETGGLTLRDFVVSFSYGSRNDLNFKYLKNLPVEEAAQCLQELLHAIPDAIDANDVSGLQQLAYEWQRRGYRTGTSYAYPDGPFAPLQKPVSESRLLLLTSSGHFVKGQDPQPLGVESMTQEEAMRRTDDFLKAPPALTPIPLATTPDELTVRHPGYDIRPAEADPGVAFPLQHLLELQRAGVIGEMVDPAYTFVGACAQTPLIRRHGPAWANKFERAGADAALLVPV